MATSNVMMMIETRNSTIAYKSFPLDTPGSSSEHNEISIIIPFEQKYGGPLGLIPSNDRLLVKTFTQGTTKVLHACKDFLT